MAAWIPTPAFLKKILADAKLAAEDGYDGWLEGLSVACSTVGLPEGVDFVYADTVVEPTYAGYANIALTFGTTYKRSDGKYATSSALVTFQEGGALTTVTIVALVIYLPGTPKVPYLVLNLTSPKMLVTADDALKFIAEVALEVAQLGGIDIVN